MGLSEQRNTPPKTGKGDDDADDDDDGGDDPDGDTDRDRGEEPVVPPDTTSWADVSRRAVNDAAYVRLRSELTTAIPEFELLVERADAEGQSWVFRGRELLQRSVDALEAGTIDEAWRHLHSARRFEIYGLERPEEQALSGDATGGRTEHDAADSDAAPTSDARDDGGDDGDEPRSELQVRAGVVREEALDTLEGWRRRAVVDLLCDDSGDRKERVTGPELRAATRILDEHYESLYLARSEQQRQFNQLVLMGVFAGLSLFVLSLVDWLLGDPSGGVTAVMATFLETPFGEGRPTVRAPGFAMFVTLAGVMGASLFGMRSLRKSSLSTKIPQQINQLTVTGARGVIGAISALLLYFALQAPLLWGGPDLMESQSVGAAMVVVGFAAGFNERMAPAVVAKVASITDSDSGEADGSEEPTEGSDSADPGESESAVDSGETDET